MKIKSIISALALSGAMLALPGCEAELQPDYERVYIGEAASSRFVKMQIEGTVASETKLTVKLVKPQSAPVTVTLGIDPALVEEYNAKNGANYLTLPAEYVTMPDKILLEPNESSATIPITILEKIR